MGETRTNKLPELHIYLTSIQNIRKNRKDSSFKDFLDEYPFENEMHVESFLAVDDMR